MVQGNEVNESETDDSQFDYKVARDSEFTKDAQVALRQKEIQLRDKMAKNQAVLRGVETVGWSLSTFSLAKFIILSTGTSGVWFVVSAIFIANQIVNRDILTDFTVNKTAEGWQVTRIDKVMRFVFQLIVSCFVVWAAVGDVVQVAKNSDDTFKAIENQIEDFQRQPDDRKNQIYIIAGLALGVGGVMALNGGGKK